MYENGGMGNEGGAGGASGASISGGGRKSGGCKGREKRGAAGQGSDGKGIYSGGQGSVREGNNICYSDSNIRHGHKSRACIRPIHMRRSNAHEDSCDISPAVMRVEVDGQELDEL